MKRREVLRITALATGSAISAPLLGSLISGCTPAAETNIPENLYFFSPEEFDVITTYVDTLLPKTDSPAASELGINLTIDQMVGTVYPLENREAYRNGFNSLMTVLKENGDFTRLPEDERIKVLLSLETGTESLAGQAHLHLKQQTIAYYLSTEEIGENYLAYLPVPGEYQPCISLSETGGKAWAI